MKTGANRENFIGHVAQVTIIIFATQISLRRLGLANEVINLADGLTPEALTLAIAGISSGSGQT